METIKSVSGKELKQVALLAIGLSSWAAVAVLAYLQGLQ